MLKASLPVLETLSVLAIRVGLLSICVSSPVGCASGAKLLRQPRELFYENQLDSAEVRLDKLASSRRGDATLAELDLAVVELFQGDFANCERRLQKVRDTWDHLEQFSATESIASMVADDKRRSYHGEDYEKLLVRVFLSLNSLINDGVDAESYSLQVMDEHLELAQQAEQRFGPRALEAYQPPPVAFYIRGMLREASMNNYDDALRAYQSAAELLPESELLARDIDRAAHSVHSQPGNGVLYVIALVGRGPYKVEVAETATSDALLIADRIVSAVGQYSVPPTLAPIKIPRLVSPTKPFDQLEVSVGDQVLGHTQPITDLHKLALETYEAKVPNIMARAIARRVIKKSAIYVAKDQLEVAAPLASFAMDAAGVAWEAAESADTRCWGLLPREIQILRVELPKGTFNLQMAPHSAGRTLPVHSVSTVEIIDGRNSYVLSYWPNQQPVGKVLVNPAP